MLTASPRLHARPTLPGTALLIPAAAPEVAPALDPKLAAGEVLVVGGCAAAAALAAAEAGAAAVLAAAFRAAESEARSLWPSVRRSNVVVSIWQQHSWYQVGEKAEGEGLVIQRHVSAVPTPMTKRFPMGIRFPLAS